MTKQEYYNIRIQNTRLVDTDLVGNSAYEILESVVAQLSDGLGENNYYYEKFWNFIDVLENPNNHKVEIRVSNLNCKRSGAFPKRWLFNPFLSQTDEEIKKWFARKIKWIVKTEAQDKKIEIPFKSNNQYEIEYLGDWTQTVADAVEVYNSLKNKNNNK
jgi:hypothetical protein